MDYSGSSVNLGSTVGNYCTLAVAPDVENTKPSLNVALDVFFACSLFTSGQEIAVTVKRMLLSAAIVSFCRVVVVREGGCA